MSKLCACLIIQRLQLKIVRSVEAPGMVSGYVIQSANDEREHVYEEMCRHGIRVLFTRSCKFPCISVMYSSNLQRSRRVVAHHLWCMMRSESWKEKDWCQMNHGWKHLRKRLQLFSVRIPYASLYSYSRALSYSLISRRGRSGVWHVCPWRFY